VTGKASGDWLEPMPPIKALARFLGPTPLRAILDQKSKLRLSGSSSLTSVHSRPRYEPRERAVYVIEQAVRLVERRTPARALSGACGDVLAPRVTVAVQVPGSPRGT
jgi:hypothetical protein